MADLNLVLEFLAALKNVSWKEVADSDLKKWIDDPKRLDVELQKFLKSFPTDTVAEPILRRVLVGMEIPAYDGSRFIANEKVVFNIHIDSAFAELQLNEPAAPTDATSVSFYKLTTQATLADMFNSLGVDLSSLHLTQSQVVDICEKSKGVVPHGTTLLFLLKKGDQFYVASAVRGVTGLKAYVYDYDYGAKFSNGPAPLYLVVADHKNCLQDNVFETPPEAQPVMQPILRRLFEDETITIAACDGARYIAIERGVFKAYIEDLFASWGLDKRGKSTIATNVSVHEMIKDATFIQMFGSLGPDLDKLCLSQHQIVELCEKHWVPHRQEGHATFFLFKEGDQFYVAYVRVRADGLDVVVRRLEDDSIWDGGFRYRLVVPQLAV